MDCPFCGGICPHVADEYQCPDWAMTFDAATAAELFAPAVEADDQEARCVSTVDALWD